MTGLTNKVQMDGDTQDYGVGLATVRNGLIIFLRRSSVYLLKGTTSANYTLIPISQGVGCLDARSIVETDHGVYFIEFARGLMLTNGTTVMDVLRSVCRGYWHGSIGDRSNRLHCATR